MTFNKFNSFVEALAEKVHNLGGDTLKVALCAAANAPVATNTVLANLTQIAYTYVLNEGTTGRQLAVSSSAQTSGIYKLAITDKILEADGGSVGPFRYVVVYNETASNDELIGWADYGSEITLNDGETFTIDFDDANGLFALQ